MRRDPDAPVEIDDEVWIKPPDSRCTTPWSRGVVTELNSRNNASVDEMTRHVLDLRPVVLPSAEDCATELEGLYEAAGEKKEVEIEEDEAASGPRYPVQDRQRPA